MRPIDALATAFVGALRAAEALAAADSETPPELLAMIRSAIATYDRSVSAEPAKDFAP